MKLQEMTWQGRKIVFDRPLHKYGFFTDTKGADGEGLDVFVGPDKSSKKVYIFYQDRSDKPGEVKTVIGCQSRREAQTLYCRKFKTMRLVKSVKQLSIKQFKREIRTTWSV